MSYQVHLRTCSYCNGTHNPKPAVRIKMASSPRERKLSSLAALITGDSYSRVSFVGEKKAKTEGAYMPTSIDMNTITKAAKLRELSWLIRGL